MGTTPAMFGAPASITCDMGCGTSLAVRANRRTGPPRWFREGGAPKGWRVDRSTGMRFYVCPRCVAREEARRGA
jgi:hypothetical protein